MHLISMTKQENKMLVSTLTHAYSFPVPKQFAYIMRMLKISFVIVTTKSNRAVPISNFHRLQK